jgi:hypothetical protein
MHLNLRTGFLATLLGTTTVLAGCETVSYDERKAIFEARNASYIGRHVDELILAFGPPTESFELSRGGRVLQWSNARTVTGGGDSYTTYDTVRNVREVRDQDGVVRRVEDSIQVPVTRTNPVYTRTLECRIRWQVEPDGSVANFTWEGNSCF